MSEWIDARACDETEQQHMIRFGHGDRSFIIVRDHADRFCRADGPCTHEAVHLSDGLVVEATIECSKHSSVFNCATGEAETTPARETLKTYPTKVENGRVFVDIRS